LSSNELFNVHNFQDLIKQQSSKDSNDTLALIQMDATLKDLLLLWFSVGFMKVQRITWQTSCDILQKVLKFFQFINEIQVLIN
jgi:hypothetical protein